MVPLWSLSSHIQHHKDEDLTHPEKDPECYYYTAKQWQHFPQLFKGIVRISNTFSGRLILGPPLDIIATIRSAIRAFITGDHPAIAMWLVHFGLLGLLFYWMAGYGISAIFYILVISYPALSLTKVRSFFEHRAAENSAARSTLNEAAWPWRLLYFKPQLSFGSPRFTGFTLVWIAPDLSGKSGSISASQRAICGEWLY